MEVATFAGGCFWRMQSIFSQVPGVVSTVVGYSGGYVANPTYQQVRTGTTGHAESLQIAYNPQYVSYGRLLEIFFSSHDSSTLNRQGADVGTNYRSIVFYHTVAQGRMAMEYIQRMKMSRAIPVVTEVVPYQAFYPAEAYHQFYEQRQQQQKQLYYPYRYAYY